MARINILHITPLLTVGGAEKKLISLLAGLDRDEFSHHVLYATPGEFNSAIENAGIPLVRTSPMSLLDPRSLRTAWRIYRYIKRKRIDLVHCHLDVAYIIGGIAAVMARVPLLFSFQNIADERHLGYYQVFKYLEKACAPFTHAILVESAEVRDVLLSWGIAQNKLVVVPNGVEVPEDLRTIRERGAATREQLGLDGCVIVGNMARLVDFKNHRLLLSAAARVCRQRPDARFLIIGDGPLREALIKHAEELGIEEKVRFLGTVMDFEPYLAACDLFVLSSLTESTPLALLHALAFRRPVISTAVGDIPAIIQHGENGILTPPDDAGALSDAILELIAHEDKRDVISECGWETAKRRFSIEAMITRTRDIYLAAAGR